MTTSLAASFPVELDDDEVLLDALRLRKQDVICKERLETLIRRLKQDVPTDVKEFWSWLVSSTDAQSPPATSTTRPSVPSDSTTTTTTTTTSDVEKPILLQSKDGKHHIDILKTMLHLSEYQAIQLTCLTLQKLAVTDDEEPSSLLRGLIGSQILIFYCISVYYSQKIARIQCLTELLRMEQSSDESDSLSKLGTSLLDTTTSQHWLFSMVIARLVLPPTYPTWEEVQPLLLALLDGNDAINIVMDVHNSMTFYHEQECYYLLDCLLALLYQRFFPTIADVLCLFKAFSYVQFFGNKNRRLSYLSGLICMEAMGLWRATTATTPRTSSGDESTTKANGLGRTPDSSTIITQASHRSTNRRKHRRRATAATPTTTAEASATADANTNVKTIIGSKKTTSWISDHPLLAGLEGESKNYESVIFDMKEMASILFISVTAPQQTMSDESSPRRYPQSVALLSLGLLLRLASLSYHEQPQQKLLHEELNSLAVQCVQESNDTLGGFDYMVEMMDDLFVEGQQEDDDDEESPETISYASIFIEVLSALLLGFYPMFCDQTMTTESSILLLKKEIVLKSKDIQFICQAASTVFHKKPTLCMLFWSEWQDQQPTAMTCLLQTTYFLAEEGARQQHPQNIGESICQLSSYITLLSSLCNNSLELIQYATSSMLPPSWVSLWLEAVVNFHSTMLRQAKTNNEEDTAAVVKWIEKAFEALKDIASVHPQFLQQILKNNISYHLPRMYRISISPLGRTSVNATLLLSYLCSGREEKKYNETFELPYEEESAIQWTMELVSLLVNNYKTTMTTMLPSRVTSTSSSFGVFTDALLSADSSNSSSNAKKSYDISSLHYTAILHLVQVLASQLQPVVKESLQVTGEHLSFPDGPGGNKITLCLSYLDILCDGFLLARTMVSNVLKISDSDVKSSFMVANAALLTIEAIISALSSLLTWNTNPLHEDVTVAARQAMYSIICALSTPSSGISAAIGMFATLPVSLGWFRAMHQCYDLFQLKKITNAKKKPDHYGTLFNEVNNGEQYSLDTTLELYAGDLRSDMGRISVDEGRCENNLIFHTNLIWKTRNAALRLLQTWADTSTSTAFASYYEKVQSSRSRFLSALAFETVINLSDLSPSNLLCRSVIDDASRSFLFQLLKQADACDSAVVRHYNFSRNRDSSTINGSIGGLHVELVLRHKSMLPFEVSCIAQLTRYLETSATISCEQEIIMNDSIKCQVFKLMQVCLPRKALPCGDFHKVTSNTSSVLTYQALHGGIYLHKLLSSALTAFKSNDNRSFHSRTIERLVSFATDALDSNEVSLCSAILLGRSLDQELVADIKTQQSVEATMFTMLDALKAADKDDLQMDQLSVACSVASCFAIMWVRIRLLMNIDLHDVSEKSVARTSPRNAMERFVSLLLLNHDYWGLVMRLIIRYTSATISFCNNDQVELYSEVHHDRLPGSKRSCLEINLVGSFVRVITVELHLCRLVACDKFKVLPSEIHRVLFCDGIGNKLISMYQWTLFFVSAGLKNARVGAERTSLSTLLSFMQVYLSISCSKDAQNENGIQLGSSAFFPYSQTGDIVILLASTLCAWSNVSIDEIASASEKYSVAAAKVLLRNSAIVAEILVSVLSFCHTTLERAYLVNLEEVAEKSLLTLQLASAKLFPLAVPHYRSSYHNADELDEIGCMLRLRLMTAILLIAQSTSRASNETTTSWIKKQKSEETRICLIDIASDTLHLLNCAHLSPLEGRFNCNFGSWSAPDELLTMCVATLTALLPDNSHYKGKDLIPHVYTKKIVRTLTRNRCLDVMAHHLAAVTEKAHSLFTHHVEGHQHTQSDVPAQYLKALATLGSIVNFVSQLVLIGSYYPELLDIEILGSLTIIRSMTVNPLIETCCKKWYSWSCDNGSDMCDFRGYIPLQELLYLKSRQRQDDSIKSGSKHPFMKPHGMYMSIKVAKDDEAHKIWIQMLLLISSLVRISRSRISAGFAPDSQRKLLQGSVVLAIDFIRCYDYMVLSALQFFNPKVPIIESNELSSTAPLRRFTRNGLSEACACLSLVSELCYHDERCPSLFQQTTPNLHKALVDASLFTLQQLASFLGSASAARDLFDLVGQFRALESGNLSGTRRRGIRAKSPTAHQRVSLQLLCLHPLLANGVPNARHDAITNSHYVSSKCACMTEIDCQLNSRGTARLPEEKANSPSSPSADSFQLHVNNEFTAQIEELAACTVYHAITVIIRAHPSLMSFVYFDSMELASEDAARLVKVGTIIAVRPIEAQCCLPHDFSTGYLPQQEGLFRYAKVMGCNLMECEWLVEYLGPSELDSLPRIRDRVSFHRLGGIFDMDKLKTVLAVTPFNLKDVVERTNVSEPSIGHLMLILQWCKQQAKGRSKYSTEAASSPRVTLESLAGRASQLLLQELDLVESLDIQISDEISTEINSQLLHIFGGDIYDASSFYATADEQVSPLEELVGKELWAAIQAKLRHRLEAARRNLNAMRAKYERSPVRVLEEKSIRNLKFT